MASIADLRSVTIALAGKPPLVNPLHDGHHTVSSSSDNATRRGLGYKAELEDAMEAGLFNTTLGVDGRSCMKEHTKSEPTTNLEPSSSPPLFSSPLSPRPTLASGSTKEHSPSPLLRYSRDRRSTHNLGSPPASSSSPTSASHQSSRPWATGEKSGAVGLSSTTSPTSDGSGPSRSTSLGLAPASARTSASMELSPCTDYWLKSDSVAVEDDIVEDSDDDLNDRLNIDRRLDHLIDLTRDLLALSRHALEAPPACGYQVAYARRGSNAIEESETAYEQVEAERTVGRPKGMSTLDSGIGVPPSFHIEDGSRTLVGQPSPTPTSRVKPPKASIWSTAFNLLPLRSNSSPSRAADPIPLKSKDAPSTPSPSRPALSHSHSCTLSYSHSSPRSSFSLSNGAMCAPTTPSKRSEATQAASPTLVTRSSYSSWLRGEEDDVGGVEDGESPAKKKILDLLNGYQG